MWVQIPPRAPTSRESKLGFASKQCLLRKTISTSRNLVRRNLASCDHKQRLMPRLRHQEFSSRNQPLVFLAQRQRPPFQTRFSRSSNLREDTTSSTRGLHAGRGTENSPGSEPGGRKALWVRVPPGVPKAIPWALNNSRRCESENVDGRADVELSFTYAVSPLQFQTIRCVSYAPERGFVVFGKRTQQNGVDMMRVWPNGSGSWLPTSSCGFDSCNSLQCSRLCTLELYGVQREADERTVFQTVE